VPRSVTSCGLNAPEWVTVATPEIDPVVVGEKVTSIVQLAPAPSEAPQGVPPPATAEKSPVAEKAMLTGDMRWFVNVTVAGPLVVPTVHVPKLTLAAEIVSGKMAVPVTSKTSGLTEALVVNATAPWIDPVVEGVNLTVKAQLAPGINVVAQPDAL